MRFKVYLLRTVLILIALFIPGTISTANGSLGGLDTMVLYAPFLLFIGAVLKGKVGPSLPPEPENTSVPITPEMLASGAAGGTPRDDSKLISDADILCRLCPRCDTPVPIGEVRCYCGHVLDPDLPQYRLCPRCGNIIPPSAPACSCGHTFSSPKGITLACVKKRQEDIL